MWELDSAVSEVHKHPVPLHPLQLKIFIGRTVLASSHSQLQKTHLLRSSLPLALHISPPQCPACLRERKSALPSLWTRPSDFRSVASFPWMSQARACSWLEADSSSSCSLSIVQVTCRCSVRTQDAKSLMHPPFLPVAEQVLWTISKSFCLILSRWMNCI